MAPDPDKGGGLKGRKKGARHAWAGADKYKDYEKKRRDMMNEKMEALAQLLPNFDKEWSDKK